MSLPSPQDELPPPPAYSEADYDSKISNALQLSLATPQPQLHDAWELWDDAAFHAAQAAMKLSPDVEKQSTQGVSVQSTFQPTEPLKINKKPAGSKPLPSWLENTVHGSVPHYTDSTSNNIAADDHSIHPPAFTPQGPSLDGPPYEQIPTWSGNRSSVPSLFASPIIPSREDGHHRTPGRHSLPQIPRTQQQRPTFDYPSQRLPPTPISNFDPSMAYHQDSRLNPFQQHARSYEEQGYSHDVNLLYNASVANHLTASPRQTQWNRVAPSHHMMPSQPAYPNRLAPLRHLPSQAPAAPRFPPYSHHHLGIDPQTASYYLRHDG
ncbi:hypothetical protein APHAL10511_001874 [Amanita phalloides]|nr:hypothetical protein APHAL10511_001874 [Amanita phalloides]